MDYDDGQCAICLFHHVNKAKLRHGHVFYFQCLFNWCMVKLQCPTCRRQFNSFVTSNMPVSAFQNNSFRGTRDYCPIPNIVPQVINVPIDADSFAMTFFLFKDRAFVDWILRTQRYDLAIPIDVNLLIVDEPCAHLFSISYRRMIHHRAGTFAANGTAVSFPSRRTWTTPFASSLSQKKRRTWCKWWDAFKI